MSADRAMGSDETERRMTALYTAATHHSNKPVHVRQSRDFTRILQWQLVDAFFGQVLW